jgi:uncharacterized protein (DUF2236 family)
MGVHPGMTTALADQQTPPEVHDAMCLLGLLSGGANVAMQLSHLPVGHGVARSTVESGRVEKHPLKRGRTTTAFLVIALFGSEEERLAMRAEIAKAHRHVHSEPGDEVQYNAFDPELQLWVAACLYRGAEDVYLKVFGEMAPDRHDALYQYASRLGTTLQVTEEMWPADRAAFEEYWNAGLATVQYDDLTRAHVRSVADFSFLFHRLGRVGTPLKWLVRRPGLFISGGFLPQQFRDGLGIEWSDRRQRRFDRFIRVAAAITRALPRPLRGFPPNLYLWDTRRRIRLDRAVV